MTKRYARRESGDESWKVVYTSTGSVVTVEGDPLEDLPEDEAEDYLARLEAGELVPDPSDGP